MTVAAFTTVARAGTPDEDFDANIPKTNAINEELDEATAAIYLSYGSLTASLPQIETAMAHAQADVDKQNAILQRGIDQCEADPEYNKEHRRFWLQVAILLNKEQHQLNERRASIQKKLAKSQ